MILIDLTRNTYSVCSTSLARILTKYNITQTKERNLPTINLDSTKLSSFAILKTSEKFSLISMELKFDFSGYIDKFYSSRPYHFLNYESINNFIKKDLRLTDTPASANYFIQMVVFFLMGNKMINLRKVENLLADHQKNELNPSDPLISTWDQIKVQKDELEWITHLSPLKSLYGEYEKLMSLIHQAADYNNDIQMTIDDTLKYFKKTIVASALYQTIRLKYQEQSRRINDYNSIKRRLQYFIDKNWI